MSLKIAIVTSLHRETLKHLIASFKLENIDCRSKKMMCDALLGLSDITAKLLLQYLSKSEVEVVCKRYGIPDKGSGTKLIELLLQKEGQDKPPVNKIIPPLRNSVSSVLSGTVEGLSPNSCFVAIDFETADYGHDSACAVGLVKVSGTQIIERTQFLIRPPRRTFLFTSLHGISWNHVAAEPTFRELWPYIVKRLEGAAFLAAHNAHFDRSVLMACCQAASIFPPVIPFQCTVQLARKTWNLRRANLPSVCTFLGIPLRHHHAISDAEACAKIVIAARQYRRPC